MDEAVDALLAKRTQRNEVVIACCVLLRIPVLPILHIER